MSVCMSSRSDKGEKEMNYVTKSKKPIRPRRVLGKKLCFFSSMYKDFHVSFILLSVSVREE